MKSQLESEKNGLAHYDNYFLKFLLNNLQKSKISLISFPNHRFGKLKIKKSKKENKEILPDHC